MICRMMIQADTNTYRPPKLKVEGSQFINMVACLPYRITGSICWCSIRPASSVTVTE